MTKLYFTYPKTHVLLSGHSYAFTPHEPVDVHADHVRDILSAGAILLQGEAPPPPPPEAILPPIKPVPTGEERQQRIREAIEVVITRKGAEYRDDYNAAGRVKPKVIAALIGFEPSTVEIATIMASM